MPESATDDRRPIGDGIDLGPTIGVDSAGLRALLGTTASRQSVTAHPPPDSTSTGLGSEVVALRRQRLAATASLLAVCFGVLLTWHLSIRTQHGWVGWLLISSRFVLAAVVAGLLFSPIARPAWGSARWKSRCSAA